MRGALWLDGLARPADHHLARERLVHLGHEGAEGGVLVRQDAVPGEDELTAADQDPLLDGVGQPQRPEAGVCRHVGRERIHAPARAGAGSGR